MSNYTSETFDSRSPPRWTCPTCGLGTLRLIEKFNITPDSATRAQERADYWELEWNCYVFSGTLVCAECHDAVAVAGTGCGDVDVDDDTGQLEYFTSLRPQYFTPPLRIIRRVLGDNVPEVIEKLLMKAFELFWCDADSCLNRLRAIVEQIFAHHGVSSVDGNGRFVSLHKRIENFNKPEYAHVKSALLAAKYMGNDGNHGFSGATRQELLEAFSVIEHCLLQFYPPKPKSSEVEEIIKRVTENKGFRPRSKGQIFAPAKKSTQMLLRSRRTAKRSWLFL